MPTSQCSEKTEYGYSLELADLLQKELTDDFVEHHYTHDELVSKAKIRGITYDHATPESKEKLKDALSREAFLLHVTDMMLWEPVRQYNLARRLRITKKDNEFAYLFDRKRRVTSADAKMRAHVIVMTLVRYKIKYRIKHAKNGDVTVVIE